MTVYLEGRTLAFFPGATVRDLAGRLEDADREAWERGDLVITDEDGHELGSGGALSDGLAYSVVRTRR